MCRRIALQILQKVLYCKVWISVHKAAASVYCLCIYTLDAPRQKDRMVFGIVVYEQNHMTYILKSKSMFGQMLCIAVHPR